MTIDILFEDDYILAIDKPAGIVVNRARSVQGTTIQDWVEENYSILFNAHPQTAEEKDRYFIFKNRSGVVHRIDKETSGVLLIGKTVDSFERLQQAFKQRTVRKTYTTLVHGRVEPREGSIDAPIGRLPWNRERFGVFAGGRESHTRYTVTKLYQRSMHDLYSLVDVFPTTGRTHQIRVHLHYIHHPVVSDLFYAGRKRVKEDRIWCSRLFLHACRIVVTHPIEGRVLTIESSLPSELQSALNSLKSID